MGRPIEKVYATKRQWKRWREFPEEWLLVVAARKRNREQKKRLKLQSVKAEEGDTTVCTVYVQEALDSGKGTGEAIKASESAECAPPATRTSDADGSPEGSNAEEEGGGSLSPAQSSRERRPASRRRRVRRCDGPPYICSLCGKTARTSAKLQEHYRVVHGEAKPYSCEACGRRYLTMGGLEGHRRVHARRGQLCGETRGELEGGRPGDAGADPLRCRECGKRLKTRVTLRCHERIHTARRPYACPDCGQSFRWSNQLTRHRRSHRDR
ncbi:hypothetical protein COCON_G00000590 [Conger conger]|uniref:C2H2-type domain-containing protein n=1 Tax=Conger conger TaxID=82655 RepID=A0A9Q1I827_CONCO|nr:hypothetical protein COCON_G00000590 [Conger conger]